MYTVVYTLRYLYTAADELLYDRYFMYPFSPINIGVAQGLNQPTLSTLPYLPYP